MSEYWCGFDNQAIPFKWEWVLETGISNAADPFAHAFCMHILAEELN